MRASLYVSLILALFSSGPAQAATIIDRLEASVNSGIILLSDVQKFRRSMRLRTQIDPLFRGTSIATAGPGAPTKDIVEFLIDERLILQKFTVSDAEVEQRINAVQAENGLNREQLKAALAAEGFEFTEYFELIRAGWSKRSLIATDIQTKVTVTDDDILSHYNVYYNKGGASKTTPARDTRTYHLQLLTITLSNFKDSQSAYDVALRAQAALKKGESWEEVSKRFSDHPDKDSGGELGTLSSSQISPLIRDHVADLKPGQFSKIFGGKSSGGYFILRLKNFGDGKETVSTTPPASDPRFDSMKEELREQILNAEYQRQISLWVERERQKAFIHRAGESTLAGLPVAPADSD